jgi:uncharacterized protein
MNEGFGEQLSAARSAFRKGLYQVAFARYHELAEAGQPECQVFLAWMLGQGIGCDQDEARAAQLYERAAALGNPVGCFYFGRWLTKNGDHTTALRLYRESAKTGYLPAVFRVGYSLVRGKGAAVSMTPGYEFLEEAAAKGHAFALRELAVQDWLGARGFYKRIAAPGKFVVAVLTGAALSIWNRDSDRLRG